MENAEGARRFAAFMDANDLDAIVLQGGNACALSVTTGIPYMVVTVAQADAPATIRDRSASA